jgi:hypothetical protein
MKQQKGLDATTFIRRASLPPAERYRDAPTGSRRRVKSSSCIDPEDIPYVTRMRYKAPTPDDDEEEDGYPRRARSSTLVYRQPYAQVDTVRHTEELEEAPRRGNHPMLYIGVSLLIALAFITAYIYIPPAWQRHVDDVTYGYPRTFQTDKDVGHGGVSHFIALNWHGAIEVVEIPADPTKNQPRLYIIMRLSNQGADLVPATVSFPDVNGDGKPDLEVTVIDGANPSIWILFNDGTTFKPHL